MNKEIQKSNDMNQNFPPDNFKIPLNPNLTENNFLPRQSYEVEKPIRNESLNNNKQETIQKNIAPLPNYFQNAIRNLQNNNKNEINQNPNFPPKKESLKEHMEKGHHPNQKEKSTEKEISQEKLKKENLNTFKKDLYINKDAPPKNPIIKNDDLVKFSNSDYENLTNKQLKCILARRGLPKSGNKSELIEKIKLYVENYKTKGKNQNIMDKLSVKCRPVLESSDSDSSSSSFDSDMSEEMDEMEKFLKYYYCPGLNISDSKLKKFSSKQMEFFTNDELKTFLEFRNIPKAGNKEELIYKLKKYLKETEEKKQKIGSFSKKIQKKKKKLMEKSLEELKHLMIKNCLPMTGTKSDLVDRILKKLI